MANNLRHVVGAGLVTLLAVWAAPAAAQGAAIFRGADLKLGEQLIATSQCMTCHQRQVGGDGTAIFRPAGRINTPGALRGMVEQCNLELNLNLFPDEITAISAVLNRRHYHFQ